MASTAAVVFLIGIMFMLLGAIRARDARFEKTRRQILNNEEGDEDTRIVYKLLPRDLDTFYRTQETPSKLYSSLFSMNVEDPRRV
jgi:hypothetical protein